MSLEKILNETLADIDRYKEDQELIVVGMKKGARELYDRIRHNQSTGEAPESDGQKRNSPEPPIKESGRARR